MSIASKTVKPGGFVGSKRKASDVRGFCVHMAEGLNVAAYLSRQPKRNVSANYVVEVGGQIVAMVPELKVAGSIDPTTIRTTDDKGGYYGASHARAALGDLWRNPNKGVIAVEVAGTAKAGPSAKQQKALVALFKDCRKRYPGIVPLGHRDFQSVKPCPGKSAPMKAAFKAMGGHGTSYSAKPTPKPVPKPTPKPPTIEERLKDLERRVAALELFGASR